MSAIQRSIQDTCSICWISLNDTQHELEKCKHIFHRACIVPWVNQHNHCPFCKSDAKSIPLTPEEISNNKIQKFKLIGSRISQLAALYFAYLATEKLNEFEDPFITGPAAILSSSLLAHLNVRIDDFFDTKTNEAWISTLSFINALNLKQSNDAINYSCSLFAGLTTTGLISKVFKKFDPASNVALFALGLKSLQTDVSLIKFTSIVGSACYAYSMFLKPRDTQIYEIN